MKKYLISTLLTLSFAATAQVHCHVTRGQEQINVNIHDSSMGLMAMVSRTHPLVDYPLRRVSVEGKETSKSLIFSNTDEKFSLKLIKQDFLDESGYSYYKAELKFEDINTKIHCSLI